MRLSLTHGRKELSYDSNNSCSTRFSYSATSISDYTSTSSYTNRLTTTAPKVAPPPQPPQSPPVPAPTVSPPLAPASPPQASPSAPPASPPLALTPITLPPAPAPAKHKKKHKHKRHYHAPPPAPTPPSPPSRPVLTDSQDTSPAPSPFQNANGGNALNQLEGRVAMWLSTVLGTLLLLAITA
ncbi:hypothetical protein Bca101_030623 [Brassica carinata]